MTTEYWEIWYPRAGATGLLVGRGKAEAADRVLVHSAPEVLTVDLRDSDGNRLALGEDLERTLKSPMCVLRRDGSSIAREDIWPSDEHLGLPVLLPGGEFGVLKSWQHSEDRTSWHWQVEFCNASDSGEMTWPASFTDEGVDQSGNGERKRPAFMGATKNGSRLE